MFLAIKTLRISLQSATIKATKKAITVALY